MLHMTHVRWVLLVRSAVLLLQMAKGNAGSLLVFDPAKIDFASDDKVKSAAGDAVVGIITERGLYVRQHGLPLRLFQLYSLAKASRSSRDVLSFCFASEHMGSVGTVLAYMIILSMPTCIVSHICCAPDYLTKVVVKGKSSTNVHVNEVMTPAAKLMTVTPNHSVLEVMEMMNDNNFRHVPVVCA